MCKLDPFLGGRRLCVLKITRHWWRVAGGGGGAVRRKSEGNPHDNLLFETKFTSFLRQPILLPGRQWDVTSPPAGGVQHQSCLPKLQLVWNAGPNSLPAPKAWVFLICISPFPCRAWIPPWNAATWPASKSPEWILTTCSCGVCLHLPPSRVLAASASPWMGVLATWGHFCLTPGMVTVWTFQLLTQSGPHGDKLQNKSKFLLLKTLIFFSLAITCSISVASEVPLALHFLNILSAPAPRLFPWGLSLPWSWMSVTFKCPHCWKDNSIFTSFWRGPEAPADKEADCSPSMSELAWSLELGMSTELRPNQPLSPEDDWQKQDVFCRSAIAFPFFDVFLLFQHCPSGFQSPLSLPVLPLLKESSLSDIQD